MKYTWGIWSLGLAVVVGVACSTEDDTPRGGGASGEAGEPSAGHAGKDNQGGGGAGGSAGDAGAAGAPLQHSCTKPVTDPATGLVTCQEGYRHRPKAVTCGALDGAGGEGGKGGDGSARLPRAGEGVLCSGPGTGGAGGATGSGDCDEYEHGFCKFYDGAGGAIGLCRSGCANDGECGPGFVCVCDEPDSPTGGACKPANCATDADCGAGLLCASYQGGCNVDGFACQLPNDECQSNADCDEGTCNWHKDQPRHFCDDRVCLN